MRLRPHHIPATGDDRPVDTLLGYVWRMSGWHQIVICLLALFVAVLSMAPLELQRRVIDSALEQADLDLLIWLGAMFLAVLFANSILKLCLRMYQGWLAESAVHYSRKHLLDIHMNRRNEVDGESDGDGRAVSIIGAEIDKLGGFVGEGLSQPVVNGGMLIAIFGYMLAVEPLVALLGLGLLVPQVLITPLIQKRINRLVEKRLDLVRDLSDRVSEDETTDKAASRVDALFRNRMRTFLIKYSMKALLNLANGMAPLGVLVAGGILVINGETTVGVIVAFVTGFERMGNPLRELLNFYRVAAQASVQHRMIAKWM